MSKVVSMGPQHGLIWNTWGSINYILDDLRHLRHNLQRWKQYLNNLGSGADARPKMVTLGCSILGRFSGKNLLFEKIWK